MDGSVAILDVETRRELFRAKTAGAVITTPLVVGGCVIAGSRDYQLYGFRIRDGTIAWRYSYWYSWVESSPVLVNGLVYVGASDYSRVTALDPATGKARWSSKVYGTNWGTPLVIGNRVFTGTASQNLPGTLIAHEGGILALDRDTGSAIWRRVAPPGPPGGFGGYAGSLAGADHRLVAAGFDGQLVCLPCD